MKPQRLSCIILSTLLVNHLAARDVPEPADSSSRETRNLFQQTIFVEAETDTEGETSTVSGPLGSRLGADLFYDDWDFDGGPNPTAGETYGANASIAWGDEHSFLVSIPFYVSDIDINTQDVYEIGIDGRYKVAIHENVRIGAHASYLSEINKNFFATEEQIDTITMGPFMSFTIPASDRLDITLGALVDYIIPENVGENWQGAVGASFGISVTDNIAVSPYIIYYDTFDQNKEEKAVNLDDNYYDIGLEVNAALSEVWSINVGVRSTENFDTYDSFEGFLGSEFNF